MAKIITQSKRTKKRETMQEADIFACHTIISFLYLKHEY